MKIEEIYGKDLEVERNVMHMEMVVAVTVETIVDLLATETVRRVKVCVLSVVVN